MKTPLHYCTVAPFDFRSRKFCDDAYILTHTTGRSLESCRQELFLAEGDVAEAYAVLVGADEKLRAGPVLH